MAKYTTCRYCDGPIPAVRMPKGQLTEASYCGAPCREAALKAAKAARQATRTTCALDDCDRPARSLVATPKGMYCETHYYRMRRTGTTATRPPTARQAKGHDARGYVRVDRIGHPLAEKSGFAWEHRVVAYDARGGADPTCEWCGLRLDWAASVVVDHADDNPANNDPGNLIVSCMQCNAARGQCSARRFAESVAVRVICRVFDEERAAIVGQVVDMWEDAGCRATDPEADLRRFGVRLFATTAKPKGPAGTVSTEARV